MKEKRSTSLGKNQTPEQREKVSKAILEGAFRAANLAYIPEETAQEVLLLLSCKKFI